VALELAVELPQLFLDLFPIGDVLGGAEAAEEPAVLIKLQFGALADPSDGVADEDAVLDVVGCAIQRGAPGAVHREAVFRVHALKELVVGQLSAHRDAEHPVDLVGPLKFVPAGGEAPATDVGDGLGAIEILLALAQRLLRAPAFRDVAQHAATDPILLSENRLELGRERAAVCAEEYQLATARTIRAVQKALE